jgi:hypothetical protein
LLSVHAAAEDLGRLSSSGLWSSASTKSSSWMTKEGWLREERACPTARASDRQGVGQLSLVLSPFSFETARHFKVAPHHLHCPLDSHLTSRIWSLLRRPRNMRLIYLPKPSYRWRQTRYRLSHSSRWHLESASWNIPNLLECLEPLEAGLELASCGCARCCFSSAPKNRIVWGGEGAVSPAEAQQRLYHREVSRLLELSMSC